MIIDGLLEIVNFIIVYLLACRCGRSDSVIFVRILMEIGKAARCPIFRSKIVS